MYSSYGSASSNLLWNDQGIGSRWLTISQLISAFHWFHKKAFLSRGYSQNMIEICSVFIFICVALINYLFVLIIMDTKFLFAWLLNKRMLMLSCSWESLTWRRRSTSLIRYMKLDSQRRSFSISWLTFDRFHLNFCYNVPDFVIPIIPSIRKRSKHET